MPEQPPISASRMSFDSGSRSMSGRLATGFPPALRSPKSAASVRTWFAGPRNYLSLRGSLKAARGQARTSPNLVSAFGWFGPRRASSAAVLHSGLT